MASLTVEVKLDRDAITKKMSEILFSSMLDMSAIAKRLAPVDTGRLRSSIRLIPFIFGKTEYTLLASVEYAGDIEFGTKPHLVDVETLKGWAGRKLGDPGLSGAVAFKIATQGTQPQPFMRPALFQVQKRELGKNLRAVLK